MVKGMLLARLVRESAIVSVAGLLVVITLSLAGCPGFGEQSMSYGTLRVEPQPEDLDAPWVIYHGPLTDLGEVALVGNGTYEQDDVTPGVYSIVWEPVNGYQEPDPEDRPLQAGLTLLFTGTYVGFPGVVIVDSEPDAIEAPWVLSGPEGFEQSGTGDTQLAFTVFGEYTIDWGDVNGYVTPSPDPESATLAPDGQLIFQGVYVSE
jgi:hypothetical protein